MKLPQKVKSAGISALIVFVLMAAITWAWTAQMIMSGSKMAILLNALVSALIVFGICYFKK